MQNLALAHHGSEESIDIERSLTDSKYQVLWSNLMDDGKYEKSTSYQHVAVLILRWDDKSSDLSDKNECEALAAVFRDVFRYTVVTELLDANDTRKIQRQINMKVAKFSDTHDRVHLDENTLLIVYYGGHAQLGNYPGHLELMGKISPNDERDLKKKMDKLVWKVAEQSLVDAEADILVILDCCYAADISFRGQPKSFEYLTATGAFSETPRPGPESFTSALIYALEFLAKDQNRFTTQDLHRQILVAPEFSAHPKPEHFPRAPSLRYSHIMLHKLEYKDSSRDEFNISEDESKRQRNGHTVSLLFEFQTCPQESQIKMLGYALNKVVEENRDIDIKRIKWGGLEATQSLRLKQLRKYVNRLVTERRKSSANGLISTEFTIEAPHGRASESALATPVSILTPYNSSPPTNALDLVSDQDNFSDSSGPEQQNRSRKRPRRSFSPRQMVQ